LEVVVPNIHVNSFVRRQTSESEFSYFVGSWEDLRSLVLDGFELAKPGYRDGVILVPVPPRGFFSGVATLQEGDALVGSYRSRRCGEEPRQHVGAKDWRKPSAKGVDVVLYASSVLSENGDNELPPVRGNWEIISINANPVDSGEMPISPEVLMHNHFGSDGGTATGLSDAEFVSLLRRSFLWWRDKAMVMPII
jgi:hypothetical protein